MQLSRDWSNLVETGDLEGAVAFWVEDAVMMPPRMPVLEGKEAIRSYGEGAAQIPLGSRSAGEPLSGHVAESRDVACMIELYVTTVNDSLGNPVTTHGKVVTVWRKSPDGSWQNLVDMWNEAPPPGK